MTLLMKKRSGGKGFTLIELLVVIAIIGVLASIVLASLNTARRKSRDTRRVADMNQAKLALELYYDSNRRFPDTAAGNGTALLVPTYIATWPTDPVGTYPYMYYAGLANGPDSAAANACSTAGALCQLFHVGASVEEFGITAMGSRAGGCPEATGTGFPAGCKISLDDTTIRSRGDGGATTAYVCDNTVVAGMGCYDVLP